MSLLSDIENIYRSVQQGVKRLEGINTLSNLDTSFALVAVRCNSDNSTGKRKLHPGTIYHLLDGYCIAGSPLINEQRKNLNNIYDDYICNDISIRPHVQISAIVGQNGSGKSSLVEFIMRLINNLAAKTFGEWKHGQASERLHFIHGVHGDLWYIVDHQLFQLHVENSNVEVLILGDIQQNPCILNPRILFSDGNPNEPGPRNILPRMDDSDLRRLYDTFFYTLVSNYSLYAYNTNDFESESDTDEKERLCSARTEFDVFPTEERCWIHGLFHKNDGYQTPLVITPFRREGNINVNRENNLARERLISLLIRHEEFRKINNHLIADGLSYGPSEDRRYGLDEIRRSFGLKNLTEIGYESMSEQIVYFWGDAIGFDLTKYSNKPFYKLAIEYLVFKTIKIAYTYRQHNKDFKLIESIEDIFNPELTSDMVSSQIADYSHVTRKIHQTLAYLIYDVYSEGLEENNCISLGLDAIYDRWAKTVLPNIRENNELLRNQLTANIVSQAVIPPPFLNCSLKLHEDGDSSLEIDFKTLSSGEKQQIYAVSSILYHLDNLDSVKNDRSDPYRIPYRNVLLIFEEVELYFHPELQQQFIKLLLDGIRQFDFNSLSGIHIVLVTHSPYVLSDIPKENVLALSCNGEPSKKRLKTFCANIHEMLKDSFFLSHGSQGDFAQWEIGHIMACISIHRMHRLAFDNNRDDEQSKQDEWIHFIKDINSDNTPLYAFAHRYLSNIRNDENPYFSYSDFCGDFSEGLLRERISIIEEPLVREILHKELDNVFVLTEKEKKVARIRELEEELKRLKEDGNATS